MHNIYLHQYAPDSTTYTATHRIKSKGQLPGLVIGGESDGYQADFTQADFTRERYACTCFHRCYRQVHSRRTKSGLFVSWTPDGHLMLLWMSQAEAKTIFHPFTPIGCSFTRQVLKFVDTLTPKEENSLMTGNRQSSLTRSSSR